MERLSSGDLDGCLGHHAAETTGVGILHLTEFPPVALPVGSKESPGRRLKETQPRLSPAAPTPGFSGVIPWVRRRHCLLRSLCGGQPPTRAKPLTRSRYSVPDARLVLRFLPLNSASKGRFKNGRVKKMREDSK